MKLFGKILAFTAFSTILALPVRSAGLIVIDPAFAQAGHPVLPMSVVTPIMPGHPSRPGHPINPVNPRHTTPPVLRGSVSYGLHLKAEDIKVDINDQVAKTYISQTFVNDTDRNLAGTYLFPLPDDTTFSSFSLHIDGKPVEGKILEAAEARQQYEEIVRRMVDPGLLEYADYKTVRARIFPIPAHGTKKVELEYTQLLKAESGMLKYRFPLKSESDATPVDQIKIDMKLASKQGLRTIWSPSHVISSNKIDDQKAKVAYLGEDTVPDKDFLLYYSVSNKDLAANLLTHKNADEDGYFLLALTPPVKRQEIIGKDIVLVVDTSGSMQGPRMEQNKKALHYLINALSSNDNFNIVQFNTDVDAFKDKLVAATEANKKAALSFIDDLNAVGGTNIGDALKTANNLFVANSTRPAYLVLMTDGEPTVGETNEASLLKTVAAKKNVRIFDFGVGYDINTKLLNKLAADHHGLAQYIEPNENIETVLSQFYDKIKSPVLSNVKMVYQGIEVKDVYPKEVTDIFAGSQVLLLGKYKHSGHAQIQLTGNINNVGKSYTFPLNFVESETANTYLPRLWAMRRIGHLTDIAQQNGNSKEVVDEIVALSKKYGIISQYTSFLVTDPNEGRPVAMSKPMPREDNFGALQVRRANIMPAFLPAPPAGFAAGGGGSFESERRIAHDAVGSALNFAATAPKNGKEAVMLAKKLERFKQSTVVAESSKDVPVKTALDKTFVWQNNFWTDTSYDAKKSTKLETITFGSKEYFELLKNNPQISKYLAVGVQMIFVYKDHAYKIVQAEKS